MFLFHNNSSENTFIATVTNTVVKKPVKGLSIVCSHRVRLVIQGPAKLHTCVVLAFEWFVLGRYYGFIFEQ